MDALYQYIKKKRKEFNLTQDELAAKAGVGLRFVRDLEQGKPSLRMDKVNQVLNLFGAELIPAVKSNQMSKTAKIYYRETLAGYLSETDEGYEFLYDREYAEYKENKPVSLTLPLQVQPFKSNVLFPFFDGLIPEGWLLNIATDYWKIKPDDRFELLLATCEDAIGAVSVIAQQEK